MFPREKCVHFCSELYIFIILESDVTKGNVSHDISVVRKLLTYQASLAVFKVMWFDLQAQTICTRLIISSYFNQSSPVQVSSVSQSCPTLCDPMNHSTPGLPVHHQLPEFIQTHVHWVGDAIQPSHPLSSPSPPAPNPSQHQGLFQWVNSSHEVAKVREFQLQHQFFQGTPRTDVL